MTLSGLCSTVRRFLPVVGEPNLAPTLPRHACFVFDADYAQRCLLSHSKCCRVTLASKQVYAAMHDFPAEPLEPLHLRLLCFGWLACLSSLVKGQHGQ